MGKELIVKGISDHKTKIRKRAEKLKNSINNAKSRGLIINSHEPIEGKMFW